MPNTTVSKTTYTTENGTEQVQYRTTIPKGLAEALDLGEATLSWEIESSNALVVRKVDQ